MCIQSLIYMYMHPLYTINTPAIHPLYTINTPLNNLLNTLYTPCIRLITHIKNNLLNRVLLGSLAGFFLLLVVVVYAVQKEQGGTFGNGISRATHFIVYVIVMLQTTLYISSTATRQVIDAEGYVERGYVNRGREKGEKRERDEYPIETSLHKQYLVLFL